VCSTPLTLSGWRLGARTVDTSDQCLVHLPGYYCTELPMACNDEWDLVSTLSSGSSGQPLWGVILLPTSFFCRTHFISPWMPGPPPSTSPTPVVAAVGPAPSTPRGPAIDVSNSGGGRCRTYRQRPLGGPPSMSPTPVVAAVEPAASAP
jgi:hypothetical protein